MTTKTDVSLHLTAAELAAADAALAARRDVDVPPPSDDFMARLMADAAALQNPGAAVPPAHIAPRGWRGFFAAIGGWPAMGGLVAATVTGLWVGIAPPDALTTFAADLIGESIALDFSASTIDYGLEV